MAMPPSSPSSRRYFNIPPHSRLQLGIIADDLTGACDAGVQFSQRGFSSVALVDAFTPCRFMTALQILSTNSRNDSPSLARFKVSEAGRLLADEGRELIFKKIDSTLRGNLGAEITTAMGERRLAIVAPAFPAMGRLIVEGWLHVRGTPAPQPIHLPTLLRRQTRIHIVHLSNRRVGRGSDFLFKRLEECTTRSRTLAVMDAASQQDLAAIARAAAKLKPPPLLAGSAALAREVARILRAQYRETEPFVPEEATWHRAQGSAVVIMGSTHFASMAQCDYLVRQRPTTVVSLQPDGLRRARRAIKEGRHILVKIAPDELNQELLPHLSQIVAADAVRGIILSGGDTADLVMRSLRATGIILEREILPGIPWGRVMGGPADWKPVATKAGGFGRKGTLVAMVDYLCRIEHESA